MTFRGSLFACLNYTHPGYDKAEPPSQEGNERLYAALVTDIDPELVGRSRIAVSMVAPESTEWQPGLYIVRTLRRAVGLRAKAPYRGCYQAVLVDPAGQCHPVWGWQLLDDFAPTSANGQAFFDYLPNDRKALHILKGMMLAAKAMMTT